jgi:hypothetical protein
MKNNVNNLIAILLLLISLTSFTADKEVVFKEIEGVKITYTKQERKINATEVVEYIILKIANTNSYGVKMNWKLDLWYNGACRTCDKPSPSGYEFELNLKPGETVEGDVSKDDLMLVIWSKSVKPVREGSLTKFDFTNLIISKN